MVKGDNSREELSEADLALLTLLQNGQEQGLAKLFERYSDLVFSVALRVLRDRSAAEDVMQDVFLQIWRKPTSFISTQGNLRSWLAVVSRNRAIDLIRQRRPITPIEDIPLASLYNTSKHIENAIIMGHLRISINELPLEQRAALEMAFFDGMTHSEIAEMTGQPLGTVKTRIRSAMGKLLKAVEQ